MPTGVAVIWTPDTAMTVSTLQPVSYEPPWVSLALERDSKKGRDIVAAGRFRARILRADEEALTRASEASPSGGLADFDCRIRAVHPVGDHDLVLAEVLEVSVSGGVPLLYWRRGLHPFAPRYEFLRSDVAFREFLAVWEGGRLPRSDWTHAAHVAVGAAYVVRFGPGALDELRQGIKRHNAAVGTVDSSTSGYHETLTRFWAGLVSRVVEGLATEWPAACRAVERFGEERDLHRLYYSFDVVRDPTARVSWVSPDLSGPD